MSRAMVSPAQKIQMKGKDFDTLCDLVHDLSGIHLHEGKTELVRARLGKRMRLRGIRDLGDYLRYVEEDQTQSELTAMLDALSTNLTSFFRENEHFTFLKDTLLPQIAAQTNRSARPALRAWSAGCSTGEEPYTLAICLLEHLPNWRHFDPKVLATDISTRVLETARKGIYPEERLRNVPPVLRHHYFRPVVHEKRKLYAVSDEVKSIVRFRRLNLMDSWPMKRQFDFIFCRNTMIYFDKPTQARLVERFHHSLKPGGYLLVGHSESLTGIRHPLKYVKPAVYRKD